MNKFQVEPTDENLERFKQVQGDVIYWHTKDFWTFDESLRGDLGYILNFATDALFDEDLDEPEEVAERRLAFATGRLIVQTAKEIGMSPRDFRDQFNNFTTVIWTPICIWYKDEAGEMKYQLRSNLPGHEDAG